MMQVQTFEFDKTKAEEMEVLAKAIWLIAQKDFDGAAKVLIARHDLLTKDPVPVIYDPRIHAI